VYLDNRFADRHLDPSSSKAVAAPALAAALSKYRFRRFG
jgi:hypothetical protein